MLTRFSRSVSYLRMFCINLVLASFFFLTAVQMTGCDDNEGELGGPCYPDGSCNNGLECEDGICVETTVPETTTTTLVEETTTTTTTSEPGGTVVETTIEDLGMTFVSLTGGTFEMGCSPGDDECEDHEYPRHTVTISPFNISAYEITQGQWEAVMGGNPSKYFSCGSNCPVEGVSWHVVQDFIDELNSQTGKNYRLPTEAEWEYAARAGTTTKYYCGDDESCLDDIAWYLFNSGETTHPVGQKQSNSWGLYDMSGNVYEWVQDWYGEYPSTPVIDPQGPDSGSQRVTRGGSWFNDAWRCRSSLRARSYPEQPFPNMGFRLVLP